MISDDELCSWIQDYTRKTGFPPSVREITGFLKVYSTSTTHARLKNLERQGRIRSIPRCPRTVVVIP